MSSPKLHAASSDLAVPTPVTSVATTPALETKLVIEATGAEMVTVAIRRMNIGQDKNKLSLLDFIMNIFC